MLKHILVDMDGVLADFMGGVLNKFASPLDTHEEIYAKWPKGEYDFSKVLSVSSKYVWRKINNNAFFWTDLEPYPWTFDLMDQLERIAPVTISTSPSMDPGCAAGKIAWIHKMFGCNFRDYMIGHQKHLMAKQDVVLIDDCDANIARFMDAGGYGAVFPQPWNTCYEVTDPTVRLTRTIDIVQALHMLQVKNNV